MSKDILHLLKKKPSFRYEDPDTVHDEDGAIRLRGIDALETTHNGSGYKLPAADVEEAIARPIIDRATNKTIHGKGYYGRRLGTLYDEEGNNLNRELIRSGAATPMVRGNTPEDRANLRASYQFTLKSTKKGTKENDILRLLKDSGQELVDNGGIERYLTHRNKRILDEAARAKANNASVFAYSKDNLDKTAGSAVATIGRLFGLDVMDRYGKEVQAQADADIKASGYRSKYEDHVDEAWEKRGLGGVVTWMGEKAAESSASSVPPLLLGLGAVLTAPISLPAAGALTAGATLYSAVTGVGETNLKMKEKGVQNDALSVSAGVVYGVLEKFGLGKMFPVETLTKGGMTGVTKALAKEGRYDVIKDLAKEVMRKTGTEIGIENLQEGAGTGAVALAGGKFTQDELIDQVLDTAAASTPTAVGFSTASVGGEVVKHKLKERKLRESGTAESKEDIQAQFTAMFDPNSERDSVFVGAESENPVSNTPEGVIEVPSEAGVLYTTNPEKAELYKNDPSDENRAAILGFSQTKDEVADEIKETGEEPVVVQSKNQDGGVTHEEVTTPNKAEEVKAKVQAANPPDTVTEVTPGEVLATREEKVAAETIEPKQQDLFEQEAPKQKPKQEPKQEAPKQQDLFEQEAPKQEAPKQEPKQEDTAEAKPRKAWKDKPQLDVTQEEVDSKAGSSDEITRVGLSSAEGKGGSVTREELAADVLASTDDQTLKQELKEALDKGDLANPALRSALEEVVAKANKAPDSIVFKRIFESEAEDGNTVTQEDLPDSALRAALEEVIAAGDLADPAIMLEREEAASSTEVANKAGKPTITGKANKAVDKIKGKGGNATIADFKAYLEAAGVTYDEKGLPGKTKKERLQILTLSHLTGHDHTQLPPELQTHIEAGLLRKKKLPLITLAKKLSVDIAEKTDRKYDIVEKIFRSYSKDTKDDDRSNFEDVSLYNADKRTDVPVIAEQKKGSEHTTKNLRKRLAEWAANDPNGEYEFILDHATDTHNVYKLQRRPKSLDKDSVRGGLPASVLAKVALKKAKQIANKNPRDSILLEDGTRLNLKTIATLGMNNNDTQHDGEAGSTPIKVGRWLLEGFALLAEHTDIGQKITSSTVLARDNDGATHSKAFKRSMGEWLGKKYKNLTPRMPNQGALLDWVIDGVRRNLKNKPPSEDLGKWADRVGDVVISSGVTLRQARAAIENFTFIPEPGTETTISGLIAEVREATAPKIEDPKPDPADKRATHKWLIKTAKALGIKEPRGTILNIQKQITKEKEAIKKRLAKKHNKFIDRINSADDLTWLKKQLKEVRHYIATHKNKSLKARTEKQLEDIRKAKEHTPENLEKLAKEQKGLLEQLKEGGRLKSEVKGLKLKRRNIPVEDKKALQDIEKKIKETQTKAKAFNLEELRHKYERATEQIGEMRKAKEHTPENLEKLAKEQKGLLEQLKEGDRLKSVLKDLQLKQVKIKKKNEAIFLDIDRVKVKRRNFNETIEKHEEFGGENSKKEIKKLQRKIAKLEVEIDKLRGKIPRKDTRGLRDVEEKIEAAQNKLDIFTGNTYNEEIGGYSVAQLRELLELRIDQIQDIETDPNKMNEGKEEKARTKDSYGNHITYSDKRGDKQGVPVAMEHMGIQIGTIRREKLGANAGVDVERVKGLGLKLDGAVRKAINTKKLPAYWKLANEQQVRVLAGLVRTLRKIPSLKQALDKVKGIAVLDEKALANTKIRGQYSSGYIGIRESTLMNTMKRDSKHMHGALVLAHELVHSMTATRHLPNGISEYMVEGAFIKNEAAVDSSEFKKAHPVIQEMYNYYKDGTGAMVVFLKYPFSIELKDSKFYEREIFAQVGALYYIAPAQVKTDLPLTYKLMEDLDGSYRRDSFTSEEVQKTIRVHSRDTGRDGVHGGTGGNGGATQTQPKKNSGHGGGSKNGRGTTVLAGHSKKEQGTGRRGRDNQLKSKVDKGKEKALGFRIKNLLNGNTNILKKTRDGLTRLVTTLPYQLKNLPLGELILNEFFHAPGTNVRKTVSGKKATFHRAFTRRMAGWQKHFDRLFTHDKDVEAMQKQVIKDIINGTNTHMRTTQVKHLFDKMFDYIKEEQLAMGMDRADTIKNRKNFIPHIWDETAVVANKDKLFELLDKYVSKKTQVKEEIYKQLSDRGNNFSAVDMFTAPALGGARVGHDQARVVNIPTQELIDAGLIHSDLGYIFSEYNRRTMKGIEWASRFGGYREFPINAEETVSYWDASAKLKEHRDNMSNLGATGEQLRRFDTVIGALEGRLGLNMGNIWYTTQGYTLTIVNWLVLPFAMLASIPDLSGTVLRNGGEYKEAWRGMQEAFKAMRGNNDALRDTAEWLGVVNEHNASHAIMEQYEHGFMHGGAQKLNEKLFKYNGLQGFTRFSRLMALSMGKVAITRWAKENDTRRLKQLGLTKKEVDTWSKRKTHKYDVANADALDKKIGDALMQFVDEAILRPDATQRPVWASDPRFTLLWHLKQFMYSFHQVILRQAIRESKYHANKSDYWKAVTPMLALSTTIPLAAVGLLLRDTIKHIGADEEPPERDFEDWLDRSGLYGLMQMFFDVKQQDDWGNFPLLGVSGPTISKAYSIASSSTGETAFIRGMPILSQFKGLQEMVRD